MANIVYKLSTKEDKITGKREIHVRFYHGKFDVRAKTNLYVQPEYWDAEKQTVKIPNTRSNTPEKQQLIMQLSPSRLILRLYPKISGKLSSLMVAGKEFSPWIG